MGARYRLEREIASGGMGTVWAARHEITRKRVALKFLQAQLAGNAQLRRRFLSEARVTIEHPAVVSILDAFELEDAPVLVMDLLDGETLAIALGRREQLALEETLAIVKPVASALAAAHERGVVHRDLKPANIFLSRGKGDVLKPMVLDFGIAKLLEPEADGVETGTGLTLGTPCYMAPEQAVADREVDHRADIWSLGVVMYECLAGVRPVEVDSVGQLVHRLANEAITPLAALAPELPQEATTLVARMLSRDRERRPKDMSEVVAALDALTKEAPPPWHWPEPRAASEVDDGLSGARTVESPAVRSKWGLAAALGAATFAAVIVWMLMQPARHVDPPQPAAAPPETAPLEEEPPPAKTAEPTATTTPSAAPSVVRAAPRRPPASAAPPPPPPPPPAVVVPAPAPRDPSGVVEDPPF